MSLFAKAKKARENKKGFTLVELIVVLVILAILAAILVPALLGWIDKAREKQYVLQARNIIMVAQTMADEAYAAGNKTPKDYVENTKKTDIEKIADLASGDLQTLVTNLAATTTATAANHKDYTITQATVAFDVDKSTSQDIKTMYLYNGAWSETKPTAKDFTAAPAAVPGA